MRKKINNHYVELDSLKLVDKNIYYSKKGLFFVKENNNFQVLSDQQAKKLACYEKLQARKIVIHARVNNLQQKKLDQIKKENSLTSNSEAINYLIENF